MKKSHISNKPKYLYLSSSVKCTLEKTDRHGNISSYVLLPGDRKKISEDELPALHGSKYLSVCVCDEDGEILSENISMSSDYKNLIDMVRG